MPKFLAVTTTASAPGVMWCYGSTAIAHSVQVVARGCLASLTSNEREEREGGSEKDGDAVVFWTNRLFIEVMINEMFNLRATKATENPIPDSDFCTI